MDIAGNIVHGSDSAQSAQHEINLFFYSEMPAPIFTEISDFGNAVNISH